MSPVSKKRGAAEDLDDDQKVSPTAAKKSKHGIKSDGEDDDGNPFWEVSLLLLENTPKQGSPRLLCAHTRTHEDFSSQKTNLQKKNMTAVKQTPRWGVSVQGYVSR